jgi:CheY-like chemotaxis protein
MAVGPRLDKAGARTGSIVVVDDDGGVREICAEALGEAGYRVEVFAEGEEALRALAGAAAAVLVVDWKMPGLDGAEVARRARALDPRLAVLMITGSRGEAQASADRAGVDRMLDKPFLVEDLVAAVAALAKGATA